MPQLYIEQLSSVQPHLSPARSIAGQSFVKYVFEGSQVAQKIYRCIFCRRPGGLTKQHILPDRLRRLIPRTKDHHLQRLVQTTVRTGAPAVATDSVRKLNGDTGTRKLRRVCTSCNTGWMRHAEEAAFQVAEPPILDRPAVLDRPAQAKLALMACIIAAVADYDDWPMSAVTADDRQHIMQFRSPPDLWRVTIGRTHAPEWRTRWKHVAYRIGEDEPPKFFGHQTTAVMGSLIMQVSGFIADVPPLGLPMGLTPLLANDGPNSIDWCSLHPLSGDDIHFVHDMFGHRFAERMSQRSPLPQDS